MQSTLSGSPTWWEGKGERDAIHAVGQRDGRHLHLGLLLQGEGQARPQEVVQGGCALQREECQKSAEISFRLQVDSKCPYRTECGHFSYIEVLLLNLIAALTSEYSSLNLAKRNCRIVNTEIPTILSNQFPCWGKIFIQNSFALNNIAKATVTFWLDQIHIFKLIYPSSPSECLFSNVG